jgi:hypothetical protein
VVLSAQILADECPDRRVVLVDSPAFPLSGFRSSRKTRFLYLLVSGLHISPITGLPDLWQESPEHPHAQRCASGGPPSMGAWFRPGWTRGRFRDFWSSGFPASVISGDDASHLFRRTGTSAIQCVLGNGPRAGKQSAWPCCLLISGFRVFGVSELRVSPLSRFPEIRFHLTGGNRILSPRMPCRIPGTRAARLALQSVLP